MCKYYKTPTLNITIIISPLPRVVLEYKTGPLSLLAISGVISAVFYRACELLSWPFLPFHCRAYIYTYSLLSFL